MVQWARKALRGTDAEQLKKNLQDALRENQASAAKEVASGLILPVRDAIRSITKEMGTAIVTKVLGTDINRDIFCFRNPTLK
jgi:hypothetical protein